MQKSFGIWLRSARKDARLTQGELAKKAGISTSYVSTIERNATHPITEAEPRPNRDIVEALAIALQKDVDEALMAAGYAPKILTTGKPTTVDEFLTILSRAGITEFAAAIGHEGMKEASPDDLQDLLDAVRIAVEVTLQRQQSRKGDDLSPQYEPR